MKTNFKDSKTGDKFSETQYYSLVKKTETKIYIKKKQMKSQNKEAKHNNTKWKEKTTVLLT